jgi:hypothetical protein
MVTEKVAADKCPEVIFGLRMRMVRVAMLAHMGQVGAKVKELECGQASGKHPKKDQIFRREHQLEQVKRDGHEQKLPDG